MTPSEPDDEIVDEPAPSEDHQTKEDFRKRLADEYKMLQDKIDKIGAFRFTIKGWSVTVVIGASAASSAAKDLSTVVTISIGVAVMLIIFFFMEVDQVRQSNAFGDRAMRLEKAFVRIDRRRRRSFKLPFPVPFTVNEIFGGQRPGVLRGAHLIQREPRHNRRDRIIAHWRLYKRSHLSIYTLLVFLAFLLPLLPRHADIQKHWETWRMGRVHPPASPLPARQ